MSNESKKEFLLKGLNCTYCAAKIGEELSLLDGVSAAKMDFNSQTLQIDTKDECDIDNVIDKINDIISKHEHEIDIKEKILSRANKKVLLIMGLSCANCAIGIEKAIRGIEGVRTAELDFASGRMTIEVDREKDLPKIIKKASLIASSIESGVSFTEDEFLKKSEEKTKTVRKIKVLRVIAALLMLAINLFADIQAIVSISLFITAYLIAGYDIILNAIKNISKGKVFDENFLMSAATIGAIAIGQYPEAVAVMLFYQVGDSMQELAVNKSRRSIKALIDIRPGYANILVDGKENKVEPGSVETGSIIIVKPGERIPLDGIVVEGTSTLDTSALSGESLPREVSVESEVLSGSINLNGLLRIEVTKELGESTITRILELVQNAGSKKAYTENFITKFAAIYTPVVVFGALLLAILPPLIFSDAVFADWIERALVFLVVSCPCALVISIPLGFFSGIGSCSKNGILVKGSNYLEALNSVDTIVFDKTGTLTKGVFVVKDINCMIGTKDRLLEYAAYAESYSTHPIAVSILKAYDKKIDKSLIEDYDEIYGHGIKVRVKGSVIIAGNSKLMEKEGIGFDKSSDVGTIVHVAHDGQYIGNIVISDELRESSFAAVKSLREKGIKRLVMLTGDSKKTGEYIADELKLDEVYTQLLPHQKVEVLEKLGAGRSSKSKLLFVGDGINDAPVLARADIGVAMGGEGIGSDAAVQAADIVILQGEPIKLVTALEIAGRTKRVVWQNIWLALLIKGLVLLLGAFGVATMWEAVFADVGVTLLAVFNSMRVLRTKRGKNGI